MAHDDFNYTLGSPPLSAGEYAANPYNNATFSQAVAQFVNRIPASSPIDPVDMNSFKTLFNTQVFAATSDWNGILGLDQNLNAEAAFTHLAAGRATIPASEVNVFLTTIAVLRKSTTPLVPSYESIYEVYFPNGNFQARLQQFFNDAIVKNNGFFIPSQEFASWIQTLQQESPLVSAAGPTSLGAVGFDEVSVLNRIFSLLALLMNSMQKVAAVQADRLNLYTRWQAAYTTMLNDIPVFLSGDQGIAGAAGNDQLRADLNTNVAGQLRTTVQSFRTAISDDAKSLQSYVNQSNDAVNQQANMATAFIQELTTLLTAIYR